MKTLLAFILTVSSFISQSQTIEKFYDENWKETNNLQSARFYSLMEKKDSLWNQTDYFIFEKKIEMVGSYKDSLGKIRHGEFTWFYPNGNLEKKGSFDNNKREGQWIGYHANGNMSDSAFYVAGKRNG